MTRRPTHGAALLVAAVAVAGCGKVGPPLPPEPRGPLPPRDVVVRQRGREVVIAFTVSQTRGPRPAQEPAAAEVVRLDYEPGRRPPADPDAFRRRGEVVVVLNDAPLVPGVRRSVADPTLDWVGATPVGRTLRYGVRVLDRRGRPSTLVVAVDLVPVDPPPTPENVRAEATADGVRLAWDYPSVESSGFNVYRAPADGEVPERPINASPLGSQQYLDSEAAPGGAYVYLVRAAATAERPFRESASSEPVPIVAQDVFPPVAPDGLVAIQEGTAVRLFWNPNEERDLAGYRLYRSVDGGEWTPVGPELIEQPLYLDEDVRVGARVVYAVTALDRASPANESARSSTVQIDVAQEPPSRGE